MAFIKSRLRVLLAGAVAQWLVAEPADHYYYDRDENRYVDEACRRIDAQSDGDKAREMIVLIIQEETAGRQNDLRVLQPMSDRIRNEAVAEVRQILETNRQVLNEIAQLTLDTFEELKEIGPPRKGWPQRYVDVLAVEAALERVHKIVLSDEGEPRS